MNGLSIHTAKIFDAISKLECIKEYVLVGGTALSLQINNRLSEDLDFMSWKTPLDQKPEVDWPKIEKELKTIGEVKTDVLDFNQVNFVVDGVKVSFYANHMFERPKSLQMIHLKNNLSVADKYSIGSMKVELTSRRAKFRDYYDIYSLTKAGVKLSQMISGAKSYSSGRVKEKNLEAFLCNKERYGADKDFNLLEPKYKVSGEEMEQHFIKTLKQQNEYTNTIADEILNPKKSKGKSNGPKI